MWALITLSLVCKSIFVLSIQANIYADTPKVLAFGENDEVQILSDKAYRKSSDNSYEAHGNVIIKLGTDTIYGEKASISLATKVGKIWGNVRYAGPKFNLYGTQISYSLQKAEFSVKNAKLVDENFVLRGKEIVRHDSGVFKAIEAEFTTCKDCPESWSIQGQEVTVVPDDYISLKHAFVKINGVIIVYIPYVSLPIRKVRESGLLFPTIGLDFDEGFYFKQPIFWAINDNSDATFSPTVFGKRGNGLAVEYRNNLGKYSNIEFDGKTVNDKIWQPGKLDLEPSGKDEIRGAYKLNYFYHPNNKLSFWANSTYLTDLDIQSDYEEYFEKNIYMGSEKGSRLSTDYMGDSVIANLYSSFMSNSIFSDPEGFDTDYVQNTATLGVGHRPFNIFNSKGILSKINFYQNLKFDYFKQDVVNENLYYRNIQRFDYNPSLEFVLRPISHINIKMESGLDAQYYVLPTENTEKQNGYKYGNYVNTSMWVDIEKVYGRAYIQEEIVKPVLIEDTERNLIAKIPRSESEELDVRKLYRSSYKHSLKFGINHFYYNAQKYRGNERLGDQFALLEDNGRFDERDIIRGRNNTLQDVSTRTDLPESNTIELVFNNNILKKTPRPNYQMFKNFNYQLDNYEYSKIAYFNISQGLILEDNEEAATDTDDRLTRLAILSGLNLNNFSLNLSEYYFHTESKHITSLSMRHDLKRFQYELGFNYDSFSEDRRYFTIDVDFELNDIFSFRTGYYYDFELERVYESYLGTRYNPLNNCWVFDIEYRQKDEFVNNKLNLDQSISLKILINYNAKNFDSVFGVTL
ncbi:LPS-assembly protein LptD [Halobacteriovorax sp. ZH4_bin.1]|uniref:LPS-assembly protein LptD n=1 Tax=unclassified Halobacteriovorax TaxID=2639665 RepID=UPI0037120E80